MKSKLYSVRVPASEIERFEAVLAHYPGASPARIVRALILAARPVQIGNALAKLAAGKDRGQ